MKGGGRDAEFALESFIGGLDNRWRDYILVGEWRSNATQIQYTAFVRT